MYGPSFRTLIVGAVMCVSASAAAQQAAKSASAPESAVARAAAALAPVLPPGYVIGTEDVLSIVFWRDKDMSADVVVRPDGKITLPLLNEIQAAGYTPEQL